jgi:ribosomal-protein-alanine acetyltransferase
MVPDDLTEVHSIEIQSFTTPWSIKAFKHELGNKNAILRTALLGGKTIGYICVRTLLDVTCILNLAVRPGFRRMGIATMLFKDALGELRASGQHADIITLEVRESNYAALAMYEKFGFQIAGRRNGYYKKPREDAIIMTLK